MSDQHFTPERVKEIRARVKEGQKIFDVIKKIGKRIAVILAILAFILHSQYWEKSPEGKSELKKEKFEQAVEEAAALIRREAELRELTCGNFWGMNDPQCQPQEKQAQASETPLLPPPKAEVRCPAESYITLAPGQFGARMARIMGVPAGCTVSIETSPRGATIDVGRGDSRASVFEQPNYQPQNDWRTITCYGECSWIWARNRSGRDVRLTIRMWPSIGDGD